MQCFLCRTLSIFLTRLGHMLVTYNCFCGVHTVEYCILLFSVSTFPVSPSYSRECKVKVGDKEFTLKSDMVTVNRYTKKVHGQ